MDLENTTRTIVRCRTANSPLVAQYDPIEYTIKYDPNLPDATGMAENQTYVYDTADFTLTADTFASTSQGFPQLEPDARRCNRKLIPRARSLTMR